MAIPYSLALLKIIFASYSAFRILLHASVGHPLAASSSELPYKFHWLPVHHRNDRINLKIALHTFKILTLNQPSYLSSLFNA
jgi:hypothetical protein